MEQQQSEEQQIEQLHTLVQEEIARLKEMSQPIARVCGPLTSGGGLGYEKNAERLTRATDILKERGYSVWDWAPSEVYIKDMTLPWPTIMEEFHKPILQSGYITEAFFLPSWEQSNGAKAEHDYAETAHVAVKEFPEAWFE